MKIKTLSLTLIMVIGLFLISVHVLASGFPLSISDNSIQKGLDYLESIQQPDGSAGTYSDTGWVVIALAATGVVFANSEVSQANPIPNHQLRQMMAGMRYRCESVVLYPMAKAEHSMAVAPVAQKRGWPFRHKATAPRITAARPTHRNWCASSWVQDSNLRGTRAAGSENRNWR